jgi:methyl-accepting chemotaxis protein
MESRSQTKSPHGAVSLADIFMQGAMRIVDMQTAAARVFLQTQGRSARMFGAPDWSPSFNGPSEQISELVSTGTEQAMSLVRHASEAISEVQHQFGQLVEQQTAQLAEEMRHGMKEVSRRAEDSLEQMRQTTGRATREARRATESARTTTAGAVRHAGRRRARKGR